MLILFIFSDNPQLLWWCIMDKTNTPSSQTIGLCEHETLQIKHATLNIMHQHKQLSAIALSIIIIVIIIMQTFITKHWTYSQFDKDVQTQFFFHMMLYIFRFDLNFQAIPFTWDRITGDVLDVSDSLYSSEMSQTSSP